MRVCVVITCHCVCCVLLLFFLVLLFSRVVTLRGSEVFYALNFHQNSKHPDMFRILASIDSIVWKNIFFWSQPIACTYQEVMVTTSVGGRVPSLLSSLVSLVLTPSQEDTPAPTVSMEACHRATACWDGYANRPGSWPSAV